jgi:hypothetical protein
MLYTQGELERARTLLTRALALARSGGDIELMVHGEFVSGHVEHAAGNLAAAERSFRSSVERFNEAGIAWGTGHVMTALAWVALANGDVGQAERLLDEAMVVLRHAGPWFLLLGLYIRGIIAVRRGTPDEALALVRESLARIRQLGDKFAFVYALVPLAAAAVLRGDDAWAARILGAQNAVTETTGATIVDKSVDDLRAQGERQARARLGADRWALEFAAGRQMSIDMILKDIDGVLQP